MKNFFLLLQIDKRVDSPLSTPDSASISIWFWIALLELLCIVILILYSRKRKDNLKFGDISKEKLRNAKKSNVDMDNLMNSINGSKTLYKELSRACHPDRFINSDKQKIAEEIFQAISKNKRDFKKLSELKQRAVEQLKINFK